MAPPRTVVTASSCSLLLTYRPRKDIRMSWPSWRNYSGRFTHISGHPSAVGRAQDSESSLVKDQRSTAEPRKLGTNQGKSRLRSKLRSERRSMLICCQIFKVVSTSMSTSTGGRSMSKGDSRDGRSGKTARKHTMTVLTLLSVILLVVFDRQAAYRPTFHRLKCVKRTNSVITRHT